MTRSSGPRRAPASPARAPAPAAARRSPRPASAGSRAGARPRSGTRPVRCAWCLPSAFGRFLYIQSVRGAGLGRGRLAIAPPQLRQHFLAQQVDALEPLVVAEAQVVDD